MSTAPRLKYTAPVRRGFAELIHRRLPEHVEQYIAHWQRPGTPRDQRLSSADAADLRAAVAWLTQEARLEEPADTTTADTTPADPSAPVTQEAHT